MIKRVMRRWVSLAMTCIMVLGMLPSTAILAAEAAKIAGVDGLSASGTFEEITGGFISEATSTPYKAAQGCSSATNAVRQTPKKAMLMSN